MIVSDFERNREGWTFDGSRDGLVYRSGGYIRGGDGGNKFFDAGPEWLGDLGKQFGHTFSFKMRQDGFGPTWAIGGQIKITASDGDYIWRTFDAYDDQSWHKYAFRLDQFSGWLARDGLAASVDDILGVLADVTSVQMRGDSRWSGSYTDLDDVKMTLEPPDQVHLVRPDRILSTFDKSGEGWSFRNDVLAFHHTASGGEKGGAIEAEDYTSGGVMYFEAPEEFTGVKSGFYGGTLGYSARTVGTIGLSEHGEDVVIEGANGTSIVWTAATAPGADWASFKVRLNDSALWHLETDAGPLATARQIKGVLGDILSLRIRGEYINGPETCSLDNVELKARSGRFDILSNPADAALVATTNSLTKALDVLKDGNVLRIGRGPVVDADFQIRANDVTIDGPGDLQGHVTLGENVRKLTLDNAGATLTIDGNALSNRISASGLDTKEMKLYGGKGHDVLMGDSESFKGKALLYGGPGPDRLTGGSSANKLFGGGGNDTLTGGPLRDVLTGGGGQDTFRFENRPGLDILRDFATGVDKIDLTAYGYTTFDDLTFGAHKGDLTIELGAIGLIVFQDYQLQTQLSPEDFLFHG